MARLSEQALRELSMLGSREVGGRVPASLIRAVIQQESGGDPEAGSPAGAQGLMQLMPGTARGLGVRNVHNPRQNVLGGARYLAAQLERFGSVPLALSAYNSGPGGAEARGAIEQLPETQAYVRNVQALEKGFRALDQGGPVRGFADLPQMPGIAGAAGPPMPPREDPRARAIAALNAASTTIEQARPSQTSLEILSRLGGTAGRVQKASMAPIALPHPRQPKGPAYQQAMQIPGAVDSVPELPVGGKTIGGFNVTFGTKLQELIQAVRKQGGKLYVNSGARDPVEQGRLFKAALAKYGSVAEARKHVAPPGKSYHDVHAGLKHGIGDGALAADLGGDLNLAHQLAPHFGLYFPMSYEPWHAQLAGVK